jgi:hypothetical protein
MDALGCGLPASGARPPSLQWRSAVQHSAVVIAVAVAVAGSYSQPRSVCAQCAVRGRTAVGDGPSQRLGRMAVGGGRRGLLVAWHVGRRWSVARWAAARQLGLGFEERPVV